jgi:hypothetical protein
MKNQHDSSQGLLSKVGNGSGLTYAEVGVQRPPIISSDEDILKATYADCAFQPRNQTGLRRRAFGPTRYCVCPHCHERALHELGIPCRSLKCPNCGKFMVSG